jgi:hypothetical protein
MCATGGFMGSHHFISSGFFTIPHPAGLHGANSGNEVDHSQLN